MIRHNSIVLSRILDINVSTLVFFLLGLSSIYSFHSGNYFQVWLSTLLMFLTTIYIVYKYKTKRIGLLSLFVYAIILLPFIHIPPYIWFDYNSKPIWLWGLVTNPYMLDEETIRLTGLLGATSAFGLAFAVSLLRNPLTRDENLNANDSRWEIKSLIMPLWLVWVFIGIGLSWISAPQDTIFISKYTQSTSLNVGLNFSSAWMMSYVVLSFAFVDALLDRNNKRRSLKKKIIFATVAFIVIWLQLLRGDRESLPWVLGLFILYFYWNPNEGRKIIRARVPWVKIGIVLILIFTVSMIIGDVRHNLTGTEISEAFTLVISILTDGTIQFTDLLHGTWSAVLLTPLSIAGDHINGQATINWGADYLDLILSLPPGFVADILDYVRPLDATSGPAWEMRYGLGGTHASVVPFMNFRMTGVFTILALIFYVIARYERRAMKKITVRNMCLLVTLVAAAPHWFWYGDKNGINAIILYTILSLLYGVSIRMSYKKYIAQIVQG